MTDTQPKVAVLVRCENCSGTSIITFGYDRVNRNLDSYGDTFDPEYTWKCPHCPIQGKWKDQFSTKGVKITSDVVDASNQKFPQGDHWDRIQANVGTQKQRESFQAVVIDGQTNAQRARDTGLHTASISDHVAGLLNNLGGGGTPHDRNAEA